MALVDADGDHCVPSDNITNVSNLKIVLASPPRHRKKRRWLVQDTRNRGQTWVMAPWTTQDLFVSAYVSFTLATFFCSHLSRFFIYRSDILPHRLKEAVHICGTTPCRCLRAAESAVGLSRAETDIKDAVRDVKDIMETLRSLYGNGDKSTSHWLFQISPAVNRSLEGSIVEPVSEWALDQLVVQMEVQDQRGPYTLYRRIRGYSTAEAFRERLWENRVHKYLRSLSTATQFRIHSLADRTANPLTIEFSSDVMHASFARFKELGGILTTSVQDQKSCYLRPLSKSSATFDSILYQPRFNSSEFQPLICFHITEAEQHDIKLSSLQGTQTACKMTIPELSSLRPSVARKWIIVFVVPENMGRTFGLQKILKESQVWSSKTAQYILELSPETVMQC